jgi:hypothetical protein
MEKRKLRKLYLRAQNYKCGYCRNLLLYREAVLDHDHATGKIRSVVHRHCNNEIGFLENNMSRLTSYLKLSESLSAAIGSHTYPVIRG